MPCASWHGFTAFDGDLGWGAIMVLAFLFCFVSLCFLIIVLMIFPFSFPWGAFFDSHLREYIFFWKKTEVGARRGRGRGRRGRVGSDTHGFFHAHFTIRHSLTFFFVFFAGYIGVALFIMLGVLFSPLFFFFVFVFVFFFLLGWLGNWMGTLRMIADRSLDFHFHFFHFSLLLWFNGEYELIWFIAL